MKMSVGKRIMSVVLSICLVLSMIPVFVSQMEVEANALSVSSLTCASYISNATARSYIDKMMKYYINSSSTLQSNLTSGKPVVFMFEGGSDNYWTGSDYANSVYDVRIQAAVFVVKLDSSGNAYVSFCSENCSSIPSYAPNCTEGVGYSGSTTILDGVYRMYRWNHTGPYAAFQLDIVNSNAGGLGLYTPSTVPDGQLLGCNGINVHTRSTTSGSYWSEGCQLIGTGNDSTNEFNAFFNAVTGFGFNPWISWNPKTLYTYGDYGYYYGESYTMGYFVVDRQLGMLGADGTKYGTGSLNEIYNTTALGKLTSYSTAAAEAAGALDFDYISANCTYYPAHCKIKVTLDQAPVNTLPCSIGTTSDNETLESPAAGTTYTATGLFKNGYGNYWYRVITSSGETGYIYGGEVAYVEQLTSDITLTGYDTPNGHVAGSVFYVNGTIASQYNQLNSAAVWIHSGFGTSGTKITGGSDTVSNNKYVLDNSDIDYNTAFNEVSTGNYTYAISVNYTNYYAEGATTLKSNTDTLYLCDEYFVVVSSSVTQSSCTHSCTTTNVGSGSCEEDLTVVKSCSKCGYITQTTTSGSHSYGSWTTVAATCTNAGSKSRTCSVCGNKETETIAAIGHDYDLNVIEATCTACAKYEYTCGNCGGSYSYSGEELSTIWLEEIPEGMDASLFTTKNQYRYSDLETTTSYATSLSGYTLKSSAWEQSGTNTVTYVDTWDSGFSTSSSLYTTYNKKGSKVTASETETVKTVINSDAVAGYLWFHWCPGSGIYSTQYQTGSYTNFHAFYSTTVNPNNTNDYDSGDGSHRIDSSTACSNSTWYWPVAVYAQKSTTYRKLFTYQRWGEYSDWSDTAATASSTRQVETRTLYQLADTDLADHSWNSGVITTVSSCTTAGVKTYTCNSCGTTKTEAIEMTGHSYSSVTVDPTCTQTGYTKHTCANCGDSYMTDEVAALDHNWTDANCTTAKTCSVCGATDGAALGHDWTDATCTSSAICVTCGAVNGSALGHDYQATVIAPECLKDGYTIYTCSRCGSSYNDDFVNATGHSWQNATCTAPKTCSVCGTTSGNVLGHSYEAVVTAPTCTEAGYTTYTCSACGDSYVADEVAALGHSYEAVVTAPTCTEAGYTTYTCSVCGDSYVADEVAALGHGALTYALTDNVHTFTCNVCGEVAMTKEATDGKTFKINSAAPVLSDDIVMKYRATVPAGFENAYMVFDFDGEQFTVTDYTIDESTGRYCYAFPGINSLKMGLNICATLYATVDGVQVSVQIAEYSMLKYCDNQLKKTTTTDTLRTVLSDVLTYGAKAQTYVGYMTDALVTDLVSDSSTLTPSAFPEGGLTDDYNKQVVSGTAIDAVNYNGVTLLLGSKVRLRLTVTCTDLTGYTYKITVGSNVYEFTGADLEATSTANRYYLYFDNLRAIDFGEIITCTIECDGVQVSRSLQYTVYTYIYKNQNTSDTALKELLQAIYNYGESAKKV